MTLVHVSERWNVGATQDGHVEVVAVEPEHGLPAEVYRVVRDHVGLSHVGPGANELA